MARRVRVRQDNAGNETGREGKARAAGWQETYYEVITLPL